MQGPPPVDHEIDATLGYAGARGSTFVTAWLMWALTAAAPTIGLEVDYAAPEACPPRARFEAELAARSERLRLVAPDETPQARVSLRIVEQKRRFVGTSKVRTLMSGVTTREFKSAQCEALVQAAALATSLLLDPEGTRLGTVAVAAVPMPIDAGTPPVLDAGIEPVVDAGTVNVVDAGAAVVVVEAKTVDAGSPPEPSPVEVAVWAGGGATSALSGAVDAVTQVAVSLSWRFVSLRLTPYFGPGRRVESSLGVAQYGFGGGRFDATAALPLGPLRLEAGAGMFVTAVPIEAPVAEVPGRGLGWLVAPSPLARVTFSVWRLRFALEGGLGINVRAEQYVIAGAGVIVTAPRVFGFASGLIGFQL